MFINQIFKKSLNINIYDINKFIIYLLIYSISCDKNNEKENRRIIDSRAFNLHNRIL